MRHSHAADEFHSCLTHQHIYHRHGGGPSTTVMPAKAGIHDLLSDD
jgi:hypothetical protein